MVGLSLREAAQQVGVNKSTIFRAIKSGRMSAGRADTGDYAIDPAELFRVFEPRTDAEPVAKASVRQDASGVSVEEATELRIRNERLEAQLMALRDGLEAEKRRVEDERRRCDELRVERDRWAAQAERLALPKPEPVRRSWWWRRAG
jgi:excisionase family DNA binding protein